MMLRAPPVEVIGKILPEELEARFRPGYATALPLTEDAYRSLRFSCQIPARMIVPTASTGPPMICRGLLLRRKRL